MATPDRPHSESQSSSDDDEQRPRPKRLSNRRIVDGFDNLTADDVRGNHRKVAFIAGQRRRRRFTPRRRKEVAAVRSVGACRSCRARKVRCTHVLRAASRSPSPSASIAIKKKRFPQNESLDSSNPSSLSSNSSIATQIGVSRLDTYLDSIEDDPPAGRLTEGSWPSYPTIESRSRLPQKIEQYLSVIPDQFQDVKDHAYSPRDACIQDFDDQSKTAPSFFHPTKDVQLQQYLPVHMEPVHVWPARKPLPSGEQPPWDRRTGRPTTQPSRSAKNGVNKKPPKPNSNGRGTPSVQGQQDQHVPRTPPPQIIPQDQHMQDAPTLAPEWTYPQRQLGFTPAYQPLFAANQPAQGILSGSSPFPSDGQPVRYGPQQYDPRQAHRNQVQHYLTPGQTPSRRTYPGPSSMMRTGSAHSTHSMQSIGNGMQRTPQYLAPSQNSSQQAYAASSSSMLRSGSAHSTHSMQSVGNGMQHMHISPQYTPGPSYQGYGNTAQVPQRLWQQPARQLSYATNMDNNISSPVSYSSTPMPTQLGYQPLPGDYASTPTPNRLAPSALCYHDMNQPLNYDTNTPTTSNSNNGIRNHFNNHLAIPAAPAATYATSQAPSLTLGASSEITPNTPNTPFDVASHHSGGELFSPQNQQVSSDMGFFSHPDMSTDQLFLNGFGPDVNDNLSPELGQQDDYDSTSDTVKPPPVTVPTNTSVALNVEVDMGDLSDWLTPVGIGAEVGNISDWLLSSPGSDFLNGSYGAMGDDGIKPRPAGDVGIFGEDTDIDGLDWNGLSPNMSDSVDGDRGDT